MRNKFNGQDYLSIIGGIALLVAIVVGISYFTKEKEVDDNYFRSQYLTGCMEDGNYSFCDCSYDALKKDLGFDGLVAMSVDYSTSGVMPSEVYKSVARCIDRL